MSKRALFLDRDGVLNPDVGYPHRLSDAKLYDDVIPALRAIIKAGYSIFVISNQSGVARGLFSLADVRRFNKALCRELQDRGIAIFPRQFYICPHAASDRCECRKPKPGLLLRVSREHDVRLGESFLVGDKELDVQAGRRAGVFTIRLSRSGRVKRSKADRVVSSLRQAAGLIRRQRTGLANHPPSRARRGYGQ